MSTQRRLQWRFPVSSAITRYRYVAEDARIEVQYDRGSAVYSYPCDRSTFDELELAESKGRFVQRRIKPFGGTKLSV